MMCTEESVRPFGFEMGVEAFPPALVVGRYAFSRAGIRLHLERDGIPVAGEVGDADEILAAVRTLRPALAFFDLFEAGQEEFDLIGRLRDESPRTRVGMFVREPTLDHLKEALRAGVSAFITKGVPTVAPLRSMVRHMLSGGLIVDPELLAQFVAGIPWSQLQPTQNDVLVLSRLGDRDREIVRLLAHGASAPDIGGALSVSAGTVRNRLMKIYDLLGVSSRSEAVAFAVRCGLAS